MRLRSWLLGFHSHWLPVELLSLPALGHGAGGYGIICACFGDRGTWGGRGKGPGKALICSCHQRWALEPLQDPPDPSQNTTPE